MNSMINLDDLMRGGVAQRFNHALKEVLKNIQDPNTPAKKARKITLTISLTPKSDKRDTLDIDVQARTSLVPRESISSIILVGVDEDGVVTAREYTHEIPGQIDMDGNIQEQKIRPISQLK